MAITLDDALKLFHTNRAALRDPLDSTNPLNREVNEALAAGIPESQIVDLLVTAYRNAKYSAMETLEKSARNRKATALHREMDEYAVDRD